jgi:hypothetical protein
MLVTDCSTTPRIRTEALVLVYLARAEADMQFIPRNSSKLNKP